MDGADAVALDVLELPPPRPPRRSASNASLRQLRRMDGGVSPLDREQKRGAAGLVVPRPEAKKLAARRALSNLRRLERYGGLDLTSTDASISSHHRHYLPAEPPSASAMSDSSMGGRSYASLSEVRRSAHGPSPYTQLRRLRAAAPQQHLPPAAAAAGAAALSVREESKASRPGSIVSRPAGWTVRRPVRLVFKDIRLARMVEAKGCLKLGRGKRKGPAGPQLRPVLKGVSGWAEPGEMIAVMGPSGSGKTTMLNVLAGRTMPSAKLELTGEVLMNGHLATAQDRKALTAFVEQDDVLLGTLTPRETIEFSAAMRLPHLSERAREERVTQLLQDLGIERCADTRIGNIGNGISGGQRRRVSIAVELVTEPSLLFLDEPTSGLDSTTSFTVMQAVRSLADKGRTVLCTIHSPSSKIFALFDKVLLMASGRVVYFGGVAEGLAHFSALGSPCPPLANPAEFLLRLVHGRSAQERSRVKELAEAYVKIQPQQLLLQRQHAARLGQLPNVVSKKRKARKAQLGLIPQLGHLTQRTWRNYVREPVNTAVRLVENIFLALFVGLLYLNTGTNQVSVHARIGFIFFMINIQGLIATVNSVLSFSEERALLMRERSSNMYSLLAYFLGKTLLEIPIQIIMALVFSLIGYYMVGMQDGSEQFLKFLLAVIMIGNAMQSVGLLVGAVVPSTTIGLMLCPIIMVPYMLMTGFFVNLDSIPAYLIWIEKLAPHRWVFEALMGVEFTGLRLQCDPQEMHRVDHSGGVWEFCPVTNGLQVLETFHMRPDAYWENMGAVTALFLGFRVLAFFGLKYAPAGGIGGQG